MFFIICALCGFCVILSYFSIRILYFFIMCVRFFFNLEWLQRDSECPSPLPSRQLQSALIRLPCRQCQCACLSLLYISTYYGHKPNNNAPNYIQYYCIIYEVQCVQKPLHLSRAEHDILPVCPYVHG